MAVCEMCGKDSKLTLADVEGVELSVCPNCVKYGTVQKRAITNRFKKNFQSHKKNIPDLKITATFSSLIKAEREKRKLTQEDFAKFLNEKESVLHKWENGSLKPRIGVAKQLERILEIKIVERDEKKIFEQKKEKSSRDGFTLGDFIKTRKPK